MPGPVSPRVCPDGVVVAWISDVVDAVAPDATSIGAKASALNRAILPPFSE